MNITSLLQNKIKALVIAFAAILVGLFIGFLTANTSAIPYTGDDTPPSPTPAFNVYTGVPDVGDESEFFYGKVESDATSVKNVTSTCATGTRFALRVYVHNGASQHNNGDGNGPSVAKNTKVKVEVPGDEASSFVPEATISASNASAISDTMTITCSDGRVVTMKYVPGTAEQYSALSGVQPVSDSIVTTGAPIGTYSPNGDLWGCWEQRVWVRLIVEVTEVPEKLHPAVCTALLTTILSSNQVRVDEVSFTANDAAVNNVTINYGDGSQETVNFNQLPKTHTYANEGSYTIRATLNTTFEGQSKQVTSNSCTAKVTVKKEKQPKFACEEFVLKMNDRTANVSFKPVASDGAVFKDATIKYYADGVEKNNKTTNQLNGEGKVVDSFTYDANAKDLEVIATVRFNIGEGKNMYSQQVVCKGKAVLGTTIEKCPIPGREHLPKDSPDCKDEPTPPTTTPDTGAGSIAGILTAVAAAGAFLHRKFTLGRN